MIRLFHAVQTSCYLEIAGFFGSRRRPSATAARMPDAAVEDFADRLIYP